MMSALAPWLLSVLRIVTALLYIPHGTSKIFGFPPVRGATVDLYSLLGLAGTLEIVGGTLILVGLFTRPVAFVLAGEMAFAYFISHAPPVTEPGRSADSLLLHLSVPRGFRRGALESGPASQETRVVCAYSFVFGIVSIAV